MGVVREGNEGHRRWADVLYVLCAMYAALALHCYYSVSNKMSETDKTKKISNPILGFLSSARYT